MRFTSFRDKTLQLFWQDNEAGREALDALWIERDMLGFSAMHYEKLRGILSFLIEMDTLEEFLALPFAGFGEKKGSYVIGITGSWYLTFRMKDQKISQLDLEEIFA